MSKNDEWVELRFLYKGKVRKSTLDEVCSQWLMNMGMMTPQQLKHVEMAMSRAIFDQKVLEKLSEFKEEPDIYRGVEEKAI